MDVPFSSFDDITEMMIYIYPDIIPERSFVCMIRPNISLWIHVEIR